MLLDRVRNGLRGELDIPRYGLPFAGDNNFLFDRIEEVNSPPPVRWYSRFPEDGPRSGSVRLTVGIDRQDEAKGATDASTAGALVFDTAPRLTFTKPMKATINGKSIQNPNWASILHVVIAQVRAKGFEGEKLVRELSVPTKATSYEDDGYRFYPELGISVQGQSSADAWKEVDRLAKKWRIPVTVEFVWRQNPKAQHPGKAGVLRSGNA